MILDITIKKIINYKKDKKLSIIQAGKNLK
jgi:hypothetical protein